MLLLVLGSRPDRRGATEPPANIRSLDPATTLKCVARSGWPTGAPRSDPTRTARTAGVTCTRALAGSYASGDDRLALGGRRIPFIGALEALPVAPASLARLRLGSQVAALGTLLEHRLVPDDEITRRVIRASEE